MVHDRFNRRFAESGLDTAQDGLIPDDMVGGIEIDAIRFAALNLP
jgi:hypothetical protein